MTRRRPVQLLVLVLFVSVGATPQAQQARTRPAFDVASVRSAAEPVLQTTPTRQGGRVIWTTDLWYLVGYAYRLPPGRISGPIPGSDRLYTVEALFDQAATDDDVREMFQVLLADRFKMTSHVITSEAEGYALSVHPNGLKVSHADDVPAPLPEWIPPGTSPDDVEGRIFTTTPQRGVLATTARRITMRQFCEELERVLSMPVFDRTSLQGHYYFAIRYTTEPGDVPVPVLFTVVQEELGLRLTRQRGPVETLVVDHIERVPTPN